MLTIPYVLSQLAARFAIRIHPHPIPSLCFCRHELAGVVTSVGSGVTKFKVGQHVGVGCMVGSCRSSDCDACHKDLEQYCPGRVYTFNDKDADGPTMGGYSSRMVCREE